MTDTLRIRIYYEDTDAGGVVYYANYLRFAERGRTEFVRARGVDQRALLADPGIAFVVRKVVADYLAPSRLDDELLVETAIARVGGASLVMDQRILRGGVTIFTAEVTLVAMTLSGPQAGRPARLDADLRHRLGADAR
ncbi:MAG: tol-pal system-associated acyl-CoA thioesterase [Paracoccaceae bacterium]